MKQVASDAADAVTHSAVVEKATAAASQAVDAVTHTGAYEAVQEAAHNFVEGAKHVLEAKSPEETKGTKEAKSPEENQATEANQTGTLGFDEAEAETKKVNEDGQAGEHPKPEIEL